MWLAWTEVCSKWKIHTRSQRLGSKRRYFKHFFSFWPGRHAGSLFPDQGLICAPCNWKHGVLTTRPPEKSKKNYFNYLINFYIGYMLKWYFRYIGLANILKSIAVVSFYLFYWPAYRELMATHCSILAWRIPWAVEPGRLWSIRSQRVWHDWSNLSVAALDQIMGKICHQSLWIWGWQTSLHIIFFVCLRASMLEYLSSILLHMYQAILITLQGKS